MDLEEKYLNISSVTPPPTPREEIQIAHPGVVP